MMVEVWLVVALITEDGTRRYIDARRPTIEACLEEAGEYLRAASEQPGPGEIVARCSVVLKPKDPA